MEKNSNLTTLADVSAVLTYIGSIFHEPLQIPNVLFYGCIGVAVVGTSYSIVSRSKKMFEWLDLPDALTGLKPSDAAIHHKHFSTIKNDVKITFSKDCKTAIFTQTRTVVCNNPFATKYYYRLVPTDGFYSLKHNIGRIVKDTKQSNNDGVDVIIDLKEPMKVGESRVFILSFKINSSVFKNPIAEYWCFRKYYIGSEVYNLELDFPKMFAPKFAWLELVDNEDFQNPRFIKNLDVKEDGRRTIRLAKYKLKKASEKLYIKWAW